ncbi:nitrite reductase small subunit [Saccharospirillum sp. MSK14-1]|uniref:nitrite reductase small subunit NirD n=1 Tax=Saccharospirillum sp. MSK14-1 TaxID=1897632 RepID=UPI000D342D57|nr:nitrite reductase small subunit NirD [Saccharospirillum sp. MSK14-1]PTY36241.1 nitrite reductase small subunit [Saccharospirillum sp. MSK14-1]
MTVQTQNLKWVQLCQRGDLVAESGVAARLEDQQLALFYLPDENRVYAIDNHDPFSQANVLARGLIGDLHGEWVVASPIYKQHFRLTDGQCLEASEVQLKTWPARLNNNNVEIALAL